MRIYIICPVANGTPSSVENHVQKMEEEGHQVHFPPRDVNQDDTTGGYRICVEHGRAMRESDRVDVFYDERSGGSKFDLGMAFILNKRINLVEVLNQDESMSKSYLKMLKMYIEEQNKRDWMD